MYKLYAYCIPMQGLLQEEALILVQMVLMGCLARLANSKIGKNLIFNLNNENIN